MRIWTEFLRLHFGLDHIIFPSMKSPFSHPLTHTVGWYQTWWTPVATPFQQVRNWPSHIYCLPRKDNYPHPVCNLIKLSLRGSTGHSHTATQRRGWSQSSRLHHHIRQNEELRPLDQAAMKLPAWPYSKCRGNRVLMEKKTVVPLREASYTGVSYVLNIHAWVHDYVYWCMFACVFTTNYLCISCGAALMVVCQVSVSVKISQFTDILCHRTWGKPVL